jgi:hypothetical protein
MSDFDYFSIEDSEDDGDEAVHCLILDTASGEYGWHYIERETLAENGPW